MKKYIVLFVSLVFVLILNIYFRTSPINFPQLKTRAKDIIKQRILQEAIQDIDKKFPEFGPLAKKKLVEFFISDYKKQNKEKIKKQFQEEYLKLKDKYQDETGQTYLMELDCWHWARYVDNVSRAGIIGDEIVDGKQLDSLMLAPSGSVVSWERFLFYLSAFLYKIYSLINPIPLFRFLFYLPLLFITIFIIVLYLFCFYHWGNLAAIITCLFVGLAPIFLGRSCAGWFDKDILTSLFPLLAVWTYLKAYDVTSLRQRLFWICFSGFWIGLFSSVWTNWWFIFLIIIIYEIYSLGNLGLFKQHLFSLFLFSLFSFFWIIILSGFEPLVALFTQVKGALTLNKPLILSVWPNVYSTVGELRKADFLQIINSVGGIFLFVFSLSCMLILFLRSLHNPKFTGFRRESTIIFTFWFISMYFACFRGIRFAMFILIPLGISLGWIIDEAYLYFRNKNKIWIASLVLVITIISVAKFINNASNAAKDIFPLMNDIWYKTLISIKETTPKDAIINSWWDFGDWFKVVSKRRVIFDGQSQNTPQAYWMARVLITENEEEAIRILRMLNNGGNQTFEIINQHLKDPFKSVMLLEKIILSESKEAEETLLKYLPSSLAEKAMKLFFNKPDKAYFIVDYTMINKVSSISFLGNWNFAKVYLAQNLNKIGKGKIIDYLIALGLDSQQVQRFYQEAGLLSNKDLDQWISPRVKFHDGLVVGKDKKDIIFFDNGLVYNFNGQATHLYSSHDKKYKIPKSLFILEKDKLKEIVYPESDLDYSVLIFKTQEDYQAILLDRQLANSLLVRLYFLGGVGLKHFKSFIEEKDQDHHIRVFEIIWE